MCEQYFEEYGNKTMLISKFLPIRSMVPIVAGVIQKPTIPYILQSALSATLRSLSGWNPMSLLRSIPKDKLKVSYGQIAELHHSR